MNRPPPQSHRSVCEAPDALDDPDALDEAHAELHYTHAKRLQQVPGTVMNAPQMHRSRAPVVPLSSTWQLLNSSWTYEVASAGARAASVACNHKIFQFAHVFWSTHERARETDDSCWLNKCVHLDILRQRGPLGGADFLEGSYNTELKKVHTIPYFQVSKLC